MPAAVILEFEGVGLKEYEAVNAELGIDMTSGKGDWPKGLTTHLAGTTDSGLVVAEVWDSQADQAAFMEARLGAALGKVGVAAPARVTWVDVAVEHRP